MAQINSLTPEQERQLIEHRDYWLKVGLSCEPVDKERASKSISLLYKEIGQKPPYFWFVDSPLMGELIINILANLRQNLWQNLWQNLRQNLGQNLGQNLWQNLRQNLGQNLGVIPLIKYNGTYFWGQQDAYWIAFYKFPEEFLGIKYAEKDSCLLNLWSEIAHSCCWWWSYKNICIISDRLKVIRKKRMQLHANEKPALEFRDGYCLWFLNGVEVPREIVLTPADKLDPSLVLKEKNAERRREIVRKIGIENVCRKLETKIIDKWNGYELLELPVPGMETKARFLKMKNPSIDTFHIEGVSPNCNTVAEALHFRKPDELQKIPINDENGLDYYQQGDVVVWPKDAHAIKRFPRILT